MTDITTTGAIVTRRVRSLRLKLPKLTPLGTAIGAMARAVGQAFDMAYVAPYQSRRRQPHSGSDRLPDGRDPSW